MKRFTAGALALGLAATLMLPTAAALDKEETLELLERYYVYEIPPEVYQQETPEEILRALGDPYTEYMTAEEYQMLLQGVNGQTLVGMGVIIHMEEDGRLIIQDILPNSPALEAGLEEGDQILAIDGVKITPETDYLTMLAGEEDTSVILTISRQGETADYVVLMTYEWGYTYGPAMAVAPVSQVRRVLDYATQAIPAGRILMGIPNYGYDRTLPFAQGTAARSLTNVEAVTLAGQVEAAIQYDQAAQSPFFRYYDGDGRQHEVWFEDARSLQAKYALVNEYGLAGVSFWNLNNLFRTNFLMLESMFTVEKVL